MKSIFPYPTLAGGVDLSVIRVAVDQVDLPVSMFSAAERVVALHEIEGRDWQNTLVSVKATVPFRELEQGNWHDATVAVVAREKATNFRSTTPLRREADGSWTGRVTLDRVNHLAAVDLETIVVATVEDVPGRLIGEGEHPWRVDLTAKAPTRTSYVDIIAADFGAPEYSFLEPFKDDPWVIGANATKPVVYVNTRVEGLWTLLNDSGDATTKALHGVVSAQIAGETWTAMLHMALQSVEAEDGDPVWPGGWQENVLRRMLPGIFPDRSPEDALRALLLPGEIADLQTRIVHAAGVQAQLSRHLGGAIRAVAKSSPQGI